MDCKKLTLAVALVVATAGVTHTLSSQDGGHDMDAMMAAWAETMEPGPEHADLAKSVGTWKVASKWWMDPAAPPQESEATSTIRMLMGGRYMHESFRGNEPDPMTDRIFEGQLLLGYHRDAKEYQAVWIDNMGTGLHYSSGNTNAEGDFELRGLMKDFMTPEGRPYRATTTHARDGSIAFRMYGTMHGGPEFLMMENVYTK